MQLDAATQSPDQLSHRDMRFLERLMRKGYFGEVTVTFNGGRVSHIRVNQLYKPIELPED